MRVGFWHYSRGSVWEGVCVSLGRDGVGHRAYWFIGRDQAGAARPSSGSGWRVERRCWRERVWLCAYIERQPSRGSLAGTRLAPTYSVEEQPALGYTYAYLVSPRAVSIHEAFSLVPVLMKRARLTAFILWLRMLFLQINENDDLPTNACRKCVDNVNNWHIFKTVCERTQNKLQSLIKKDGSQLEEVGFFIWLFWAWNCHLMNNFVYNFSSCFFSWI